MVVVELSSQELDNHVIAVFLGGLFVALLALLADRFDRIDRGEGTLSELLSQFDLRVANYWNSNLGVRVIIGVDRVVVLASQSLAGILDNTLTSLRREFFGLEVQLEGRHRSLRQALLLLNNFHGISGRHDCMLIVICKLLIFDLWALVVLVYSIRDFTNEFKVVLLRGVMLIYVPFSNGIGSEV